MPLSALLLAVVIAFAQPVDEFNVPTIPRKDLDEQRFKHLYNLSSALNPFYLRGDFDGDGMSDYAFLIAPVQGSKRGIAIWLSSRPRRRIRMKSRRD